MARLLQRDLRPVYVFENREQESDYVGTETVPVYVRTVSANVQPAENKITAEAFGQSVYDMMRIICPKDSGIGELCTVSFTDTEQPTHEVTSVSCCRDHMIVLVKKVHG